MRSVSAHWFWCYHEKPRQFFKENGKSLFKMKEIYFCCSNFYVSSPYLCAVIVCFSLNQFRRFPEVLGKSRNPRWQPFFHNHDVITTSYEVITSRYGPLRKHLWTYYPMVQAKLSSIALSKWRIGRGGGPPPPPPPPPPGHRRPKECPVKVGLMNDVYVLPLSELRYSNTAGEYWFSMDFTI